MSKEKTKTYKCHYCGKQILNDKDLVIKPVPLATKSGVRNYKRKFHFDCMKEYLDTLDSAEVRREENTWWEKCYDKAKEWMNISEGQNLDQHFVMRLKGLRVGKFLPNGDNTHIVKRGYDFETIFRTMQLSESAVKKVLSERNFANQEHKINYIMIMVIKNVNFVHSKLKAKRQSEELLTKSMAKTNEQINAKTSKYVRKSKSDNKKQSKVTSMINDLMEEQDEMESLFN